MKIKRLINCIIGKFLNKLQVKIDNLNWSLIPVDNDFSSKFIKELEKSEITPLIYPEIDHIRERTSIAHFQPSLNLFLFNNVTKYVGSDLIRENKTYYLYKFTHFSSSKMIPQDVDIIGSSEQKLKVRNKKPTYYFEIVIGFEGVNVGVWSHFLIESFPKLLYLDSFLETDKMYVLILPVGIDEQILEIVKLFTEKYNNIELCFLPSNICFSARVYYYIPKISFIMDHSVVSSYGDIIIPTYTKNALLALKMKCLQIYTEPRLSKPKSRIYIPRRGKRGITNSSELETMFLEFGFEIIEPTLLTLKEKVLIFSECEIIAGGLGSGLSNLVFSKNQVKLIVFNNIYRIDDTYLGYLCDLFNVELLHLACPTLMSSLDAPIYVEIDKVKKQIKSFLSV